MGLAPSHRQVFTHSRDSGKTVTLELDPDIDGLGHGSEATAAAKKTVEIIDAHSEESVISLVQRCHEGLKATRGATVTVVTFNNRENIVTALKHSMGRRRF